MRMLRDATDAIPRICADLSINSSHDRLAHTLAHLLDPGNSKSDLFSPKLARYDFLKKKIFLDDGRPVIRVQRGWILDDG